LIKRSNEIGGIFNYQLNLLKHEYPEHILEVRNTGSMIALELMSNGDVEQPNTALTQAIIANAAEHGLILLACGFYGNVIRFLPALTASDEIIHEGLAKFANLFAQLVNKMTDK
jgi:4-aminobutyrate aminotransferase/(S)-3-amino-2-methylpropionate transaminase